MQIRTLVDYFIAPTKLFNQSLIAIPEVSSITGRQESRVAVEE